MKECLYFVYVFASFTLKIICTELLNILIICTYVVYPVLNLSIYPAFGPNFYGFIVLQVNGNNNGLPEWKKEVLAKREQKL